MLLARNVQVGLASGYSRLLVDEFAAANNAGRGGISSVY